MASERAEGEDFVGSEAEEAALTALREVTGEIGGPMERHGLRCWGLYT